MSEYYDCIRKGLLKKTVPSKGKAAKSLDAASIWLMEAEDTIAKSRAFVERMKKLIEEKTGKL